MDITESTAQRSNLPTVLLIVGMSFYWPVFRLNFFDLLYSPSSPQTQDSMASLLLFLCCIAGFCCLVLLLHKRIESLFSKTKGIIVTICIGMVGHIMVFIVRFFAFENSWLIYVGLILGFAGTIALTFAWANALFYVKLQKMIHYLFVSFALNFLVTIPTAFSTTLSLLSACLCTVISTFFWVFYTRIRSKDACIENPSSSEQRRSFLNFPRGMLPILIVTLFVSGIIRSIIGIDSVEAYEPINTSSLARSLFSFTIAILVLIVSRLSHYSRRSILMSWAVILAILFAGLLIVSSLSQMEFALQIATVLVASSKTYLSFFLWITLICVPPKMFGDSLVISSTVYFLIDTVYSFLIGGVLVILKSFGFSLFGFIGPLSLLASLVFVVLALVFLNSFEVAYVDARETDSTESILESTTEQLSNFSAALEELKRVYWLTDREAEVLSLIAQGRSYQKIAETLYVTKSTVQTHVVNLYRKLGVHSKQEAIDMLLKSVEKNQ